jgi:hypothetical protein
MNAGRPSLCVFRLAFNLGRYVTAVIPIVMMFGG